LDLHPRSEREPTIARPRASSLGVPATPIPSRSPARPPARARIRRRGYRGRPVPLVMWAPAAGLRHWVLWHANVGPDGRGADSEDGRGLGWPTLVDTYRAQPKGDLR
jgi:hypothetical protein